MVPPETPDSDNVTLCPVSIVGEDGDTDGVPLSAELTPMCKSREFFVSGEYAESITIPFQV